MGFVVFRKLCNSNKKRRAIERILNVHLFFFFFCYFIQLFHTMLLPYFYEVDYDLVVLEKGSKTAPAPSAVVKKLLLLNFIAL